jgi:hypothetical protein
MYVQCSTNVLLEYNSYFLTKIINLSVRAQLYFMRNLTLTLLFSSQLSFSLGASTGYTVAVSKTMGLRRSRFRATDPTVDPRRMNIIMNEKTDEDTRY